MPATYPEGIDFMADILLTAANWATAQGITGKTSVGLPTIIKKTDPNAPRLRDRRRTTPAADGEDQILVQGLEQGHAWRGQVMAFEDYEHPVELLISTRHGLPHLNDLRDNVAQIIKDNRRDNVSADLRAASYDYIDWDSGPKNLSGSGLWVYAWTFRFIKEYTAI